MLLITCLLLSITFLGNATLASTSLNYKNQSSVDELSSLISRIEKEYNIPKNLLLSIAKVESSMNSFALNKEGKAIVVKSKEEALKIIEQSLIEGITNIDIGVMQINYRYHYHDIYGKNFNGIDDMLDPESNIKYAAKLLCKLYEKHKTWHQAVRYYHSATKIHHEKYSKKILVSWLGNS